MSNKEAISIGINNYGVGPGLRFATNDANEFASALEMPEYNFDTTRVLDFDATASNIRETISTLLAGAAQIKVIFFAGHGYAEGNDVYLATADDSGPIYTARPPLDRCGRTQASFRPSPWWWSIVTTGAKKKEARMELQYCLPITNFWLMILIVCVYLAFMGGVTIKLASDLARLRRQQSSQSQPVLPELSDQTP